GEAAGCGGYGGHPRRGAPLGLTSRAARRRPAPSSVNTVDSCRLEVHTGADAPPNGRQTGRNTMAKDKALTGKSSVGAWLKHPIGGPLIRQLLNQAGVDDKVLAPVKLLPLQNL